MASIGVYNKKTMHFLRFTLANATAIPQWQDGIRVAYFKGLWYLWGGWNGNNSPTFNYNTQWTSSDLITWTQQRDADWNPSHDFGFAHDLVNDIIYKIGSDTQPQTTVNDRGGVWKTTDGLNWTLVSNQAIFQNIALHFATCKGSDIYVGGGQIVGGSLGAWTLSASSVNTKVWKSTDGGENFSEIASGITHLGGNISDQCIYSDTFGKFIAVCCPSKYDDTAGNRTFVKGFYTSTDAITWTQQANFFGVGRQYADLCDDGSKVWMINGSVDNSGGGGTNVAEMWYYNGADWAQIVPVPLTLTHATGIATDRNKKLAIILGNGSQQVYYLERYDPEP